MAQTVRIQRGNGVQTPLVRAMLVLPDSGKDVVVRGSVLQTDGTLTPIDTGVVVPANPASPDVLRRWEVQIDTETGDAYVAWVDDHRPPMAGTLPLLFGQLLSSEEEEPDETDWPPLMGVPVRLPLLLGGLMPLAAPPGRAATIDDTSSRIAVFRQVLSSGSPAEVWANETNRVLA